MSVFEGIRLVDLSGTVATSYCGKLFASFGADVINVEPPGTGNPTRSLPPFGNAADPAESSALAGWLDDLHVPYHESVQVTGDLWDVWKKYQPSLLASDFAEREQDPVPRIACAALRRMVHSMGRGLRPSQSEVAKSLSLQEKLMMSCMASQGQGDLARLVTERHQQEEEKLQD